MRYEFIAFLLFVSPCLFGWQAVTRDLKLERIGLNAKRLALVIGNNDYKEAPLTNAVNDAADMDATLRTLGFDVVKLINAGYRDMRVAVDKLTSKIEPGDVVLFYFAGHGVQVRGSNYIIPVDFQGKDAADVQFESYPLDQVLQKLEMSEARLKIMIIDACRNNPFRVTRSLGSTGLAKVENTGEGTFIAFATGPGKVAHEMTSQRNGLFTQHLLGALARPGLKLDDVFNHVRTGVYSASKGSQLPWVESGVVGEFFFRDPLPVVSPKPIEPKIIVDRKEAEVAFWRSVQSSSNIGDFEAYLQQFPQGEFVSLARTRITTIRDTPKPPPPVDPKAIELEYWRSLQISSDPKLYDEYVKRYPQGTFVQLAMARASELRAPPPLVPAPAPMRGPNDINPGRTERNRKDRENYVFIPSGFSDIGCVESDKNCEDHEKPRYRATISKSFWLGQNEVSVGSYRLFAQQTKRKMPAAPLQNRNWADNGQPISRVSWHDAVAYCEWAGGRLPTEAEWEYAARAGHEGQLYPWAGDLTRDRANYINTGGSDVYEETAPIGKFDGNDWKLYDLAGNVWEWTADWYGSYSAEARGDPKGPESGKLKVARGGSFASSEKHLRVSMRKAFEPAKGLNNIGFRCVLNEAPLSPK